MLTGLFTVGEGYGLQPNREGCSGSLVFTHVQYGWTDPNYRKASLLKPRTILCSNFAATQHLCIQLQGADGTLRYLK